MYKCAIIVGNDDMLFIPDHLYSLVGHAWIEFVNKLLSI